MGNKDPFAAHYEFAIALVYPAFSMFFSGLGMWVMSVAILVYGLAHEVITLYRMETLVWGEKNGKWTHLFQYLYYNKPHTLLERRGAIPILLTSATIMLNFQVMYTIGLQEVNFALWVYGFMAPSLIWVMKYKSGFSSKQNFTEYRKHSIRPIVISIYIVISWQIAFKLEAVQLALYCAAIVCTCALEVVRQRIHYGNEFGAMLTKLKSTKIQLDPNHEHLQFHSVLYSDGHNFTVVTPAGKLEEYALPEKLDTAGRSVIALALISTTCGVRIRLRNIVWRNRYALIPLYIEHARKAAMLYQGADWSLDDQDIVFLFSQPVAKEFLNRAFSSLKPQDIAEIMAQISTMPDLTEVQKQAGKRQLEIFNLDRGSQTRRPVLQSSNHKKEAL